MNKISFITLTNYYQWGGSEELWQRTALFARLKGWSVDAHVFDSSRDHAKVIELIKAGVKVSFRKNTYSFFDRTIRKVRLQSVNWFDRDNYWKRNLLVEGSTYVISGGTTFDCLQFSSLFEFLNKNNLPFFYISQHHPEHSSLSLAQIEVVKGILTAAKKVFFVSQRNLDVVKKQLASDLSNAEVIYNPVNVETKRIPFMHKTEKLRLACVARLECAFKGQDIIMEVLSNDKWKSRSITVSLYGKGPDKNYLQLLANYYKIDHLIEFAGHVDNVKDIWADNDFLIMCSLTEGTPLVLMEAMACGRSAVLTDVGGNAEWITDGYNGFIAAAPTSKLLDEAMERMWQNRHRSEELGNAAFETFVRKFPSDAVEYFYNKIIHNHLESLS
jgi:glycosyltransferase involved in cell wall biosynthesis